MKFIPHFLRSREVIFKFEKKIQTMAPVTMSFVLYFVISLIMEFVNTNTAVTSKVLRHKIFKGKIGKELKVSYISMTKFENKLLVRIPNKSVYIGSITKCKVECIRHPWCVSLNFVVEDSNSFRCDLFDDTHHKQPYLLIDAKNSEHHSISVRIQFAR